MEYWSVGVLRYSSSELFLSVHTTLSLRALFGLRRLVTLTIF
jgi:hypothetical protein